MMPLQSSGIIVVEKPTPTSTTAVTTTAIAVQQQQQQQLYQTSSTTTPAYYEYYGAATNDARHKQQQQPQQHAIVVIDNSNNSQQPQLVRRSSHQRSNSGSSLNSNVAAALPTATTIQQHFNVKQQATQQQPQQQIIQHTTTHQQQLQQSQQQHVQQQQAQQQQQQQQQVIQVSEEFIEQAAASGNMMISTATGEVLNQQIFKIVNPDGSTTGNMIIDSMGNLTAATSGSVGSGGAASSSNTPNNSKVLLSNLTVLSKPATAGGLSNTTISAVQQQQQQHQQPQTINFVSAKNLSYLTSVATSVPSATGTSVVSATANNKQQKFSVAAGACKTSAVKQQHMATTPTTYVQQHQLSATASTQQQQQQILQKVPRNVQMVTRVQTIMPPSTTPTPTHQLQQQQTQMLVQQPQKFIAATTAAGSGVGSGCKANNMMKKSTTLKISQNKLLNNVQQQQQQSVKAFIPQQQLHYQTSSTNVSNNKIKSKLVKQYNNNSNVNTINHGSTGSSVGGTVTMTTLPQHQIQPPQSAVLSTYNNSINNQQKSNNHHHQQPTTTMTTKITKLSSNKYIMQNQQQQQQQHPHHQQQQQQQVHHIATLPQGTQLHNSSASAGGSSGAGGTIKFVNTQGTVIQHQQNQISIQQQPQKMSHRQQQQLQQQVHFVEATSNTSCNNALYQLPTTAQQQSASATSSSTPSTTQSSTLLSDDIMIVNGTQMTDEVSARILQSMAQKSFNNQQRYQQQLQQLQKITTAAARMPPPQQQQQQQQQQIVLQHSPVVSGANILLSPKEYPLYNSVHQQQQTTSPATITQYVQQQQQTTYLPVAGGTSSASSMPSMANRQAHSAPVSRSQSLERKAVASTALHYETYSRKSSEYYKVNNNNAVRSSNINNSNSIANLSAASSLSAAISSSFPIIDQTQQQQTQVMHLQPIKTSTETISVGGSSNASYATPPGGVASSPANDDDIIGEEVRPVPVNTEDFCLQVLHAVMQDHTYANPMPTRLPSDLSGSGGVPQTTTAIGHSKTNNNNAAVPTQSPLQSPLLPGFGLAKHWSLGGIGATVAVAATSAAEGTHSLIASSPTAAAAPLGIGVGGSNLLQSSSSSYTLHGQQIPRLQQDDDAHSAISNGSRVATGDIDPGEETETAPEAEAEDDSVTRCICDLTHDDGYMICCDKCSVWQHVDCMGIDRQNIPDEYQCELCQPRVVDKARARTLQVMKRKEQTQLLLTAQANVAGLSAAGSIGSSATGAAGSGSNVGYMSNEMIAAHQRLMGGNVPGLGADAALQTLPAASLSGNALHHHQQQQQQNPVKKAKVLKKTKETPSSRKLKKAEKLAAMIGGPASLGGSGGKALRKEVKKTTKRKSKNSGGNDGTSSSASTAAEKHAANLRQWIENYELAVTNHYSPELRARLHAITKQPSLLQSILNTENKALKDCCNQLENKATTVPHAGGKILISNFDIAPNCPIFELRGKYMLSPQYRMQNPSVNMNTPPPSNYNLGSFKAHKTPGPFIFFYQLPGAEAPMQTMNADGTYPPVPPQPAYLKGPEICVDTRTYGNEARFVRRSCRPNAEVQHLFEKGTIHFFIVSLSYIRASTEIAIRHEPHDLLAVENKRSNNFVIQPTSTACACGLTKDCLFGPPPPPPSQYTQSTAAALKQQRKAITLNGSSAAMQLTMGGVPPGGAGAGAGAGAGVGTVPKKKSQLINRNRSTSSSGDSNMGLNSPNVVTSLNLNAVCNAGIKNNNTNMLSVAHAASAGSSCMSNASSSMSSVTHDSGICTSSSSPSVSIPSPTSPTMQTQPLMVQRTLIMQHQNQQQQQHLQQQHNPQHPQCSQQTPVLLSPQMQQQQAVISAAPTSIVATQSAPTTTTLVQEYGGSTSAAGDRQEQQKQQLFMQNSNLQQLQLSPVPLQQLQQPQLLPLTHAVTNEAKLAAAALQSLNSSVSVVPEISPVANIEQQQQQQLQLNQQQPKLSPSSNMPNLIGEQQISLPAPANADTATVIIQQQQQQTFAASATSSSIPCASPMKSPQKHGVTAAPTASGAAIATCGRKTPAKNLRSISVSEDASNDQHHHSNDEANTSSSSGHNTTSTPKEKPKMSREERKMEAILRAIDKMERNQQRKQELKQSKTLANRRSSNGQTQTPPTKLDSANPATPGFGGAKKNSLSARKKKRKSHKSYNMHGTQRKRRKSRMNSNESDGGMAAASVAVASASENDSQSMLSPPLPQATATKGEPGNFSSRLNSSFNVEASLFNVNCNDAAANVDQAAGLLMAFANPNISISPKQPQSQFQSTSSSPKQQLTDDDSFKSPQRHSHGRGTTASCEPGTVSPPPTPPAPVSSACLLIEAAVGPLEHLDSDAAGSGEFKYPAKTKTKKALMSYWLHQSEGGITPPLFDTPNMSPVSGGAGGLDSLVQAAMCDYKQKDHFSNMSSRPATSSGTGSVSVSGPENLSMAAMKVEEFLHQTEGSSSPALDQQQHQHQRSTQYSATSEQYMNTTQQHPLANADLSHCLLARGGVASAAPAVGSGGSRNLHLPLQVSTCSNNSSVKKRWLRQAISEETDESSSAPVTPSTASPTSHLNAAVGALLSAAHTPNGFTTPLKKRRLVISSKDEDDITATGAGGSGTEADYVISSTTPPATHLSESPELDSVRAKVGPVGLYESGNESPMVSDDVDVVSIKCEGMEQNDALDVEDSGVDNNVVIKHELDEQIAKLEVVATRMMHEDVNAASQQQIKSEIMLDQDDDVDILRSPSPGQKMVAEDNLVKIEPEDISGADDVKIDVEREESMAGDKFEEIMQLNKMKEVDAAPEQIAAATAENEIKEEKYAVALPKGTVQLVAVKAEAKSALKKEENTSGGGASSGDGVKLPTFESKFSTPSNISSSDMKPNQMKSEDPTTKKKTKLETQQQTSLLKTSVHAVSTATATTCKSTIVESPKNSVLVAAATALALALPPPPPPPPPPSSSASASLLLNTVVSTTSAPPTTATTVAAATTTTTTPTALCVVDSTSSNNSATHSHNRKNNIERNSNSNNRILTDDDIEERLRSFHKENILILQSRNKKSKSTNSSSSSTSEAKSKSSHAHHITDSQTKSTTTALTNDSSSLTHRSHKHATHSSSTTHHKEKSSSSMHGSSSSAKKLHKSKERTCSTSSSSSNKHNNATKQSSNTTMVLSTKKVNSTIAISVNTSAAVNSTTATTASATSLDKEKDKNRQRSTSSSSSNSSTTSSTKKRQLNFGQELTKDMHLVSVKSSLGSGCGSAIKHRKEGGQRESKDGKDNQNSSKKWRESSGGGGITEKSGSNKPNTLSSSRLCLNSSGSSEQKQCDASGINKIASATTTSDESKPQMIMPVVSLHPTIPHFNNVVANSSTHIGNHVDCNFNTTTLSSPNPIPLSTSAQNNNIPPNYNIPPPNILKTLPVPIPRAVAALSTLSSSASSSSVNATPENIVSTAAAVTVNHLPYYNTIYGKLLDNPSQQQLTSPSIVSTPLPSQQTLSIDSSSGSISGINNAAMPVVLAPTTPVSEKPTTQLNLSLSDFLDSKLSFITLGTYIAESTAAIVSAANSAIAGSDNEKATGVGCSNGSSTPNTPTIAPKLPAPLKIHTKTASHDPRLNPILSAPEPPPAPKRKLSINEYRKRMQQSTDSNSGCGTPTTPDVPPTPTAARIVTTTSTTSTSLIGGTILTNDMNNSSSVAPPTTINKCSLNSPERRRSSNDDSSSSNINRHHHSHYHYDQVQQQQHDKSFLSTDSLLNSSGFSSNSNLYNLNTSSDSSLMLDDDDVATKGGQFSAAPTLLEKQQENLCERLKSLKSKQLNALISAGSLASSIVGKDYTELKKATNADHSDLEIFRKRNNSISYAASDLDNCLEAISSSSTSLASSRESSPERFHHYHKPQQRKEITLTTETVVNENRQQQHHSNSTAVATTIKTSERKRSVDTA